jgi:hypothetical protein
MKLLLFSDLVTQPGIMPQLFVMGCAAIKI